MLQSWLDVGVPGYGMSSWEPGVVDMGGRGYLPKGEKGSENSPERLCQTTAWAD